MVRLRFSASVTAELAKTLRFVVFVAVLDAGAAAGAYALTTNVKHGRVFFVIGAALLGTLAGLFLLFAWVYVTARRRILDYRVGQLEGAVEGIQAQVNTMVQDRWGEPMQFLPIYHVLRTDVREAIRIFERARDTGKLWSRTGLPEEKNWKKHRDAIGTNPFARLDGIYGELLEAFDHIERLTATTTMRFGKTGRVVREGDDLESAIEALETAEFALTSTIERLESLDAINKLQLPGDWTSPEDEVS